jgi:hypothetical protein
MTHAELPWGKCCHFAISMSCHIDGFTLPFPLPHRKSYGISQRVIKSVKGSTVARKQ